MAKCIRSVYRLSNSYRRFVGSKLLSSAALTRSFQTLTFTPDKLSPLGSVRFYSSGMSLDDKFADSQKRVTTLKNEPDNDVKLKLYALFKQSTVGKCNTKKPGALDFVGKAKWQAWDALQNLSQDEAKQQYVSAVNDLVAAEGSSKAPSEESSSSGFSVPGLLVEKKKNYLQITLNRPEKKNAITDEMYRGIRDILNTTATDDSVSFVVFRGKGDYYCSGNDLSNFTKNMGSGMSVAELAKASGILLRDYVSAYVEFPKPLVALINGPAVGIAVTVLGLCDLVYSSDTATFHTPFTALAQSPEACSTYTFPKLMGYAKANEILMLNKKVTAAEAKDLGLISQVFPAATFQQQVDKIVSDMAELPRLSMAYAKQCSRLSEIEALRKVNILECELIQERWQSEDCHKALAKFFGRKSSL